MIQEYTIFKLSRHRDGTTATTTAVDFNEVLQVIVNILFHPKFVERCAKMYGYT